MKLDIVTTVLTISVSLLGGAVTAGVTAGSTKATVEQHAKSIEELQTHDRETNGDMHALSEGVKEVRHALDRIEDRLGTK